jgi:hypothetical protein
VVDFQRYFGRLFAAVTASEFVALEDFETSGFRYGHALFLSAKRKPAKLALDGFLLPLRRNGVMTLVRGSLSRLCSNR